MIGMTVEAALAHVLATNPTFAVAPTDIRGVSYTAFQNIPPTIPALMNAGMAQHEDGASQYLLYEGERWTYGAFCAEVRRVAQVLSGQFGIGKGDRVAIAMRNYPELMVLVLAISATGATVVFLNAWWTTEELDYALRDSAAKLVFGDGPRIARLLPLVDELGLTLVGVRDGEGQAAHDYTPCKQRPLTRLWMSLLILMMILRSCIHQAPRATPKALCKRTAARLVRSLAGCCRL